MGVYRAVAGVTAIAARAARTAVSFILGSASRAQWYCGKGVQMKKTTEQQHSSQTDVTYNPHLELS